MEYIVMKYRQYFGLTYKEYLEIPPKVFFTDLQMMSLENQIENQKTKQSKNT